MKSIITILLVLAMTLISPVSGALRLNASGDRLNRTTSLPAFNGCTIMAWFKLAADRNTFTGLIQVDAAATKHIVSTDGSGTLLNYYNGAGNFPGTSNFVVGEWMHITFIVSGTAADTAKVYVNGDIDIAGGDPNTATSTDLIIGNTDDPGVTEWLDGSVAAIKVWNAALSTNELRNEMKCYLPLRTLNLVSWHPMVGSTMNHIDRSGLGATFTVSGSLDVEPGPPIPWK